MSESAFIEDGYTLHLSLPRIPGVVPAAEIDYRPALQKERLRYFKGLEGADVDVHADRQAKLLAAHVQGWNLPGEWTAERVATLHARILLPLLEAVLGYPPAQEEADRKN